MQRKITLSHQFGEKIRSINVSEKAGLKRSIQKTKIMASGPITSWLIDEETVSDFIFGGSKITADGDCSHEIKRCLLLGRKVMTNLDSIFKSRDITLPTRSEERRVGKEWKQCQTLFSWAPKSLQMMIAAMKLKGAYSLEGKL